MRLLVGKNSKVGHWKSSIPAFMVADEGGRKAGELQISNIEMDIAAVKRKIAAVEHCLKGRNSTNAPEEIREEVLIYEGADKESLRVDNRYLVSLLGKLVEDRAAARESQKAVKSEGKNR